MKIIALNFKEHVPQDYKPYVYINVTVNSKEKWGKLAPYNIGPVVGIVGRAKNMENYWQFSKVYGKYWDEDKKEPTPEFYIWREEGFNSPLSHKYPINKNRNFVGVWIDGIGLVDYPQGRKMLFIPAYVDTLKRSHIYQDLLGLVEDSWRKDLNIVILEYDSFDYQKKGLSLKEVLNDPKLKYGHGFILVDLINEYIKNNLDSKYIIQN